MKENLKYNLEQIKKIIDDIKHQENIKYIKLKLLDIRNYLDNEINLVNKEMENEKL